MIALSFDKMIYIFKKCPQKVKWEERVLSPLFNPSPAVFRGPDCATVEGVDEIIGARGGREDGATKSPGWVCCSFTCRRTFSTSFPPPGCTRSVPVVSKGPV